MVAVKTGRYMHIQKSFQCPVYRISLYLLMRILVLLINIDFHNNIAGKQKYIPKFKSYLLQKRILFSSNEINETEVCPLAFSYI